MLFLGPDQLFGGGLADGLCQALAGDRVPCRQQAIVERLTCGNCHDVCEVLVSKMLKSLGDFQQKFPRKEIAVEI